MPMDAKWLTALFICSAFKSIFFHPVNFHQRNSGKGRKATEARRAEEFLPVNAGIFSVNETGGKLTSEIKGINQ
jgi:hypothetical protein